jgi:hypothetical protein
MDALLGLLDDLKFTEVKDEKPASDQRFGKVYIVSIAGFSSSEEKS